MTVMRIQRGDVWHLTNNHHLLAFGGRSQKSMKSEIKMGKLGLTKANSEKQEAES